MSYLENLNDVQKAAVLNTQGPMMIIAGAGSGKTRVITYRIAQLIQNKADSFSILALTFTNKAAREMRERIDHVVGPEAKNIWMGTFHSVFARILRIEAEKLNYPKNFTIYDTEDSKSLLKSIIKEEDLDDKTYHVNLVMSRISAAKNNLITYQQYLLDPHLQADDHSTGKGKIGQLYKKYCERCFKAGAMDFDDLLLNTNILLHQFPEVLYKYQHKFKHIMVDEYQDTNFCQYLIVKKLAAVHQNICVVGDDAQSIYAFRGAKIENILNFEKDYPDLKVFKLEENYRSTQNIVNAANSVIANNENQLKKNVFSSKPAGDKITLNKTFTDSEEGKVVAEDILAEHTAKNLKYGEFCVLYRTNSQSRVFEESLRRLGVNYKIYGGLSFYQRKEIKDLVAYMRLAANHNDEEALKRVINYPIRGIGKTSIDKLIVTANEQNLSLFEVVSQGSKYIGGKSGSTMEQFSMMIRSFRVVMQKENAYDAAMHIAKQSTLLKDLYDDKSIEGLNRYENIQELLNGIKEFSEKEDIEDHSLDNYLSDIALLTSVDKADEVEGDFVSLMTIHNSKGLEYSHVYIVGLEEELFPSHMSMQSREDLEEERRLFYVAITRAKNKLSLSYTNTRYKWGKLINCEPSRFIDEIDPQYLNIPWKNEDKKPNYIDFSADKDHYSKLTTMAKPKATTMLKTHTINPNFAPSPLNQIVQGARVEHNKFGFGRIEKIEGVGENAKATIAFEEAGNKDMILKFAKLMVV